MPQSQLNWIDLYGGGDFVNERFAREMNLRSHRVAQMGTA